MQKEYRVELVINNNFVLTKVDGVENILTGKGIGFKKRPGDIIYENEITGQYTIQDPNEKEKFALLTKELDPEVFEITTFITNEIERRSNVKVLAFSFMALADHMQFAIERYRNHQPLTNMMMNELNRFYPHEVELCNEIIDQVNQKYSLKLNEDEAGFIALHLINLLPSTGTDGLTQLKIVSAIIKIIEEYLEVQLDENSFYYQRLVTHLKYFIFRAFNEKENLDKHKSNDFFYRMSKIQYPTLHKCVDLIEEYLDYNYQIKVGKEEKGYLIVHLSGLLSRIEHDK